MKPHELLTHLRWSSCQPPVAPSSDRYPLHHVSDPSEPTEIPKGRLLPFYDWAADPDYQQGAS